MTTPKNPAKEGNQAEVKPFTIEGQFHDGVTSRSLPAQLQINHQGATLLAAEFELQLEPADLILSDRIGDTPRRIEWQDGAAFVTHDNAGADRLQRLLPSGTLSRLAFVLESNLTLAITALLSVAVLLGAVMFWGVPTGARYLATQIPDAMTARAADEVMETLDRLYLEPSTLSNERADELRSYLAQHDNYPPRIRFRSAGEDIGPNAFALPGGHVVITDELVALAESDEEILAVYLHEVGHARALHAETNVLASSAWLVILTLITGDINGMTETVFAIPVMLGQQAFSRELEREADDYSIAQLQIHGYSPELFASILERMTTYSRDDDGGDDGDDDRGTENPDTTRTIGQDTLEPDQKERQKHIGSQIFDYLSTHPTTDERLRRIREAVR